MNNSDFYNDLTTYSKNVADEKPNYHTAEIAMACLDLTSLTGKETEKDICDLCNKALTSNIAAICVYPEYIKQAINYLSDSPVAIATVINFPLGANRNNGEVATAQTTHNDVTQAIKDGATEIDIVIDYDAFKTMDIGAETSICKILKAARSACDGHAILKVILESASFSQEQDLYDLTLLVLENGADFIKTSTGKYVPDTGEVSGATLETVVTMALALRYHNESFDTKAGLKISGGVNGNNYAQYIKITQEILGKEFLTRETFRFGASGVYSDLAITLETNGQTNHNESNKGISTGRRSLLKENSY